MASAGGISLLTWRSTAESTTVNVCRMASAYSPARAVTVTAYSPAGTEPKLKGTEANLTPLPRSVPMTRPAASVSSAVNSAFAKSPTPLTLAFMAISSPAIYTFSAVVLMKNGRVTTTASRDAPISTSTGEMLSPSLSEAMALRRQVVMLSGSLAAITARPFSSVCTVSNTGLSAKTERT